MAKQKKPAKQRNPQDATLRNNTARKREILELNAKLEGGLDGTALRFDLLEARVKALETADPKVIVEHQFPNEPD